MDPVRDVRPLCPCWVVMADGLRHRCDAPVGRSANLLGRTYTFVSGADPVAVLWAHGVGFESIADPARRLDVPPRPLAPLPPPADADGGGRVAGRQTPAATGLGWCDYRA